MVPNRMGEQKMNRRVAAVLVGAVGSFFSYWLPRSPTRGWRIERSRYCKKTLYQRDWLVARKQIVGRLENFWLPASNACGHGSAHRDPFGMISPALSNQQLKAANTGSSYQRKPNRRCCARIRTFLIDAPADLFCKRGDQF